MRHSKLGIKGFNTSYCWYEIEPLSGCIFFVFWRWILYINLWREIKIVPNK